jgi:hypothetical protein
MNSEAWDVIFLADTGQMITEDEWNALAANHHLTIKMSLGTSRSHSLVTVTRLKPIHFKILVPGLVVQLRYKACTLVGVYLPASVPLEETVPHLPSPKTYPLWIFGDFNVRWGNITGDTIFTRKRAEPLLEYMKTHKLKLACLEKAMEHVPTSLKSDTSQVDILLVNAKALLRTSDTGIGTPLCLDGLHSDHAALCWTITAAPHNGSQRPSDSLKRRIPNYNALNSVLNHASRRDHIPNCDLCKLQDRFTGRLEVIGHLLKRKYTKFLNADTAYLTCLFAFSMATLKSVGHKLVSQSSKPSARRKVDLGTCSINCLVYEVGKILNNETDNNVSVNPQSLAEIFFSPGGSPVLTVGRNPSERSPGDLVSKEPVVLDKSKLAEVIKHLKNRVAQNQEALPAAVFKISLSEGTRILGWLYDFLLTEKTVPDAWRHGKTVPVYKGKGARDNASSYRPITLIASTRKTLELLINETWNSLPMSDNQGGFRPSRGTTENLELLHYFLKANSEDDLCIMLLDIKGAYDNINREKLFSTVEKATGDVKTCNLLKSMYVDTKSEMVINGVSHGWYQTYKGTQQGAPLSCKLFNFFIDPVVDFIQEGINRLWTENPDMKKIGPKIDVRSLNGKNFMLLLFADDIIIVCLNELKIPILAALENFASEYDITFAPKKCIYIGNDEVAPTIQGGEMSFNAKAKYLGAWIDRSGIRADHFTVALATANGMISKITRKLNLDPLNVGRRVIIFKTFIRSQLEYLLQLVDILQVTPAKMYHIYRRALREIVGLNKSYDNSLVHLLLGVEPANIRLCALRKKYSWKIQESTLPIHQAIREYRGKHQTVPTVDSIKFERALENAQLEISELVAENPKLKPSRDTMLKRATELMSLDRLTQKCRKSADLIQQGSLNGMRNAIKALLPREVDALVTLSNTESRLAFLQAFSYQDPDGTDLSCLYAPEGKRFSSQVADIAN